MLSRESNLNVNRNTEQKVSTNQGPFVVERFSAVLKDLLPSIEPALKRSTTNRFMLPMRAKNGMEALHEPPTFGVPTLVGICERDGSRLKSVHQTGSS
jgi:hypothetical protein